MEPAKVVATAAATGASAQALAQAVQALGMPAVEAALPAALPPPNQLLVAMKKSLLNMTRRVPDCCCHFYRCYCWNRCQ